MITILLSVHVFSGRLLLLYVTFKCDERKILRLTESLRSAMSEVTGKVVYSNSLQVIVTTRWLATVESLQQSIGGNSISCWEAATLSFNKKTPSTTVLHFINTTKIFIIAQCSADMRYSFLSFAIRSLTLNAIVVNGVLNLSSLCSSIPANSFRCC